MAYSRRSYKGAAIANAISGSILASGATSITLATDISGSWATTDEPFFVVIDPGTTKEEKVCVVVSGANNLTVVDPAVTSVWETPSAAGRGADDTVDRQHDIGAVIYPVFTATEANQANELISKYATNGDLVTHGTSGLKKVSTGGSGNNNKVLIADSTVDGGVKWGQVTSAGITDSTIVLADLAASLQAYLVPVGTINAYAGVTAPTGWLLCNGTSTAGYTALAALVGATTPDMRGRFPIGDDSTLTLLGTGGSATIAEANLPSHTHTFSGTSDGMNQNSTPGHTVVDPGHNHTQNPHNHTQDAHGHTINDHTHTNQVTYIGTAVAHAHNNIADYVAAGTNGASTSPTVASISTTSLSANSNTATNQANTASNNSNTTSISVNAHNIAHTHTYSGTTNGGTGTGTAYYQPYLVVNYIIKHD